MMAHYITWIFPPALIWRVAACGTLVSPAEVSTTIRELPRSSLCGHRLPEELDRMTFGTSNVGNLHSRTRASRDSLRHAEPLPPRSLDKTKRFIEVRDGEGEMR